MRKVIKMSDYDAVLKQVELITDEAVKGLQDILRIDSTTGQENEAQDHIEKLLKEVGMDVDKWCDTDEDLKNHPGYFGCGAKDLGDRPNVVGTAKGSGEGRSLILNGHIDTVPAGDLSQWRHGPFLGDIEDGLIYGRGASDMKSGLIAAYYAYKAVKNAGIALKGDVIYQSAISEENGGAGTLGIVNRGYKADGAIILEPTTNIITTAELGTMLFRIIVEGKAAHGSTSYEGVSAIEKFSYVYDELMKWNADVNKNSDEINDYRFKNYKVPADLSFGSVHAGTWPAMLPSDLVAEGRYAYTLKGSILSARNDFEKELARISENDPWLKEHPVKVEWFNVAWEPYNLQDVHPLPIALQECCEALGMNTELGGVPFGSDIKYMPYVDTPAVLFGPGTIKKGHFANESVDIEEYINAIEVLACMIVKWCGNSTK